MADFKIGDEVWMISFEVEEEFYLLSKQIITDLLEDGFECEDDFNTFHVSPEDMYRSKSEALEAMISRLSQLRSELKI